MIHPAHLTKGLVARLRSCGLGSIACAATAALALCTTAAAAAPALNTTVLASNDAQSRASVIAAGFVQITGLAISPLLVLCAIGWYDFAQLGGFSATASMPLHANPWFLFPCSVVLLAVVVKKCASPVIPMPLRKLLDACEYFEAKCSALVAAGVLLPTLISMMSAVQGGSPETATHTAAFASGIAPLLWIAPLAIIVFFSVWITFHAIDALIVLSPFAIVDAMLVALRASVLAVIALAFLISPILACVLCLPIIVCSLFIAGWCIRLDLFALCVATDLLFLRRPVQGIREAPARAFLAARTHGAPIRTMGHAQPSDRGVRFHYRPFFVLPTRTLELDAKRAVLIHGTLWSTLRDEASARGLVAFPPRYSRCAEDLARAFNASLREGLLRRSWRGVREAIAAILAGPAPSSDDAAAR